MLGIDNKVPFLPINIAVLTVSDTRTEADDRSGATLVERIEAACDRQLLELADDPNAPPFPQTAKKRVAELKAEAVSRTGAV